MSSQRKTSWKKGPDPQTQKILNTAMRHVRSVPYIVSLRWVFYRLYQEGFYSTKEGYNNFEYLCSRARHTAWNGWQPDTLADETREAITRVYGYPNIKEALENFLSRNIDLELDHFYQQKHYIELWFEARAMASQFKHYTEKINLIPLGGMSSIPYKWDIAKRLERKNLKYKKPIVILYFGDEDLAGHRIQADVEEDARAWCNIDFEVVWCGLTKDQAIKYGIPKSIEKEGYQWEALDDESAAKIIKSSLDKYIDHSIIERVENETHEQEEKWTELIHRLIEDKIENE